MLALRVCSTSPVHGKNYRSISFYYRSISFCFEETTYCIKFRVIFSIVVDSTTVTKKYKAFDDEIYVKVHEFHNNIIGEQ